MTEPGHTLVPYGRYAAVWAALIALTGITLGASYLDMKHLAIFTCLLIAVVKSTLVMMYFMHLRYENRLFLKMLMIVLVTYAIFVALTFSDYAFR
jgi:cytochrome c oxidase subunit IV